MLDAHTQLDSRLGGEDLQFQIFKVLVENVNDAIGDEEVRGNDLDSAYEALTSRGLVPVTLERFQLANFHAGHRPSLIEAPVEKYPALAVMTYNIVPSPLNSMNDMTQDAGLICSVECIVKSGPYQLDDGDAGASTSDGEEVVDRRIKRTAEAIWSVLLENRDLGGYSLPESTIPTITWGEVFARDGDDGLSRYYWQGVRFQFNYTKTLPIFG